MPAMPSSTCSSPTTSEAEVTKCAYRYPECETCANHVYDPDTCDYCEDGDCYEEGDFEEDFFDRPEDMTIDEFKDFWKNAA
jgi:hypothetical protein